MVKPSSRLGEVRYEIRGALARRALELERQGYEILKLNVGNPGEFGFRTPETMRQAIVRNLGRSEAYCHQKGIFPAREAVVMQCQNRGVNQVSVEHVFMGNGVSELVDLCLRAMLEPGDEVLVPSPDYPLWTAAVILNGGRAVHYRCDRESGFCPDPDQVERLVSERTRALVVINPNNPTGAVYPRPLLQELAGIAERHGLLMFADEIYDQVIFPEAEFQPMAPLVEKTLCVSFSGLSKVYRACGYRIGWAVLSGAVQQVEEYMQALELLASLRLCANVPGQWAVQTALGGFQSIRELCAPGGRLHESRKAVLDAVAASDYLELVAPGGAMYAFPSVKTDRFPDFDDHAFAMDLLEQQHVLVVPGSSFNYSPGNHFRITLLPEAETIKTVFQRIDRQLAEVAVSG